MTNSLSKMFSRDLELLKKEINAYENEQLLWVTKKEINNSAGNLCLHLIGNLNHFIGATLGGSGYIRQRENEFSDKNILVQEMSNQINATILIIKDTLPKLSEEDLNANYPLEVFGTPMTTEFFLIHLTTHLSYHLGQITYHRRLVTQ
jgi:uncharacterized damage-inducible protein DinB